MRTPAEKFESDNLNIDMHKHVARGFGGSDEPPTLQKRSTKFAYYICNVHVGDDDLARSGVYVRTCR